MFFAIGIISVALDMWTKRLVEASMALGETRTLIPGLLDLHFLQNYGAAYSILQNKVDFLLIFTSLLLLAIAVFYAVKRKSLKLMERICLSLIFGGGCGNFISRATLGCVTDFLDIHIIPVFNVADICVTGGCFLLIIYYFFVEGRKPRVGEETGPKAAEDPEGESRDERG